jgi:hypothetical protein
MYNSLKKFGEMNLLFVWNEINLKFQINLHFLSYTILP